MDMAIARSQRTLTWRADMPISPGSASFRISLIAEKLRMLLFENSGTIPNFFNRPPSSTSSNAPEISTEIPSMRRNSTELPRQNPAAPNASAAIRQAFKRRLASAGSTKLRREFSREVMMPIRQISTQYGMTTGVARSISFHRSTVT